MANDKQTEANGLASWTIRSMDVETRQLAVNCAIKRGVSMAEWMKPAVQHQANLEAGDRIEMPGKPGQTAPQNWQTGVDLAGLEELARVCAALASAGAPIPRSVTRLMWQRVRERLGAEPGRAPPRIASIPIPAMMPPDRHQADQQRGEGE